MESLSACLNTWAAIAATNGIGIAPFKVMARYRRAMLCLRKG